MNQILTVSKVFRRVMLIWQVNPNCDYFRDKTYSTLDEPSLRHTDLLVLKSMLYSGVSRPVNARAQFIKRFFITVTYTKER